eukprot:scaffold35073_cov64-Phaeocystis_antarctica.AAC.1
MATMATMATLGARPLKKYRSPRILVGWPSWPWWPCPVNTPRPTASARGHSAGAAGKGSRLAQRMAALERERARTLA